MQKRCAWLFLAPAHNGLSLSRRGALSLAYNHGVRIWPRYGAPMDSRTNHSAAMIIDLAIILLPEVGALDAAHMLRCHHTPLPIVVRTLTTSRRRRVDVRARAL